MSGNIKYDKWINDDSSENYKCRAWVNFNGTGTVAIRASGGVSSITDNGAGEYTVNFTTVMPDANYAVSGSAKFNGTSNSGTMRVVSISSLQATQASSQTTNSISVNVAFTNGSAQDPSTCTVVCFR